MSSLMMATSGPRARRALTRLSSRTQIRRTATQENLYGNRELTEMYLRAHNAMHDVLYT